MVHLSYYFCHFSKYTFSFGKQECNLPFCSLDSQVLFINQIIDGKFLALHFTCNPVLTTCFFAQHTLVQIFTTSIDVPITMPILLIALVILFTLSLVIASLYNLSLSSLVHSEPCDRLFVQPEPWESYSV